jgi:hypothetical protein
VVAASEASRKQTAADEAAFPALAQAAEEFFAVASAADDVVAKLEGADFGLEAIGERFVVGGKTADKVAIADVHFGDEFFDAVELRAMCLDSLLVSVLPRHRDDEAAAERVDAEQERAAWRLLAG